MYSPTPISLNLIHYTTGKIMVQSNICEKLPGHVTIDGKNYPCITVFLIKQRCTYTNIETTTPVSISNYDLNRLGLNKYIHDTEHLRQCFMNPALYATYPRPNHIGLLYEHITASKSQEFTSDENAVILNVGSKGFPYKLIILKCY